MHGGRIVGYQEMDLPQKDNQLPDGRPAYKIDQPITHHLGKPFDHGAFSRHPNEHDPHVLLPTQATAGRHKSLQRPTSDPKPIPGRQRDEPIFRPDSSVVQSGIDSLLFIGKCWQREQWSADVGSEVCGDSQISVHRMHFQQSPMALLLNRKLHALCIKEGTPLPSAGKPYALRRTCDPGQQPAPKKPLQIHHYIETFSTKFGDHRRPFRQAEIKRYDLV
jgi:hypothetical protein